MKQRTPYQCLSKELWPVKLGAKDHLDGLRRYRWRGRVRRDWLCLCGMLCLQAGVIRPLCHIGDRDLEFSRRLQPYFMSARKESRSENRFDNVRDDLFVLMVRGDLASWYKH